MLSRRRLTLSTAALAAWPRAALPAPETAPSGLAAAVWRGGEAPTRLLEGEDGNGRAVRSDTIWRVASISKLAQALVALRLQARGRLDLEAPLSRTLDFRLRHPDGHEPTARELLCHHSGLRDNGDDGARLPREPLSPALLAPLWGARRFEYANLNSVVLATAMERASGLRYDRLMQQELFGPLALQAGFDPGTWDAATRARIATLQRRDALGQLEAQTPVYAEAAPASRLPPGYQPGRNALPFGPQGHLHTSLDGLIRLAEALRAQDPRLLPPAGFAALAQPLWRRPGAPRGELFQAWSTGAQLFTDTEGGDRLHARGGWQGLGHLAAAYGLYGGLIVQPARAGDPGWALVFLLHGSREAPGRHSAFTAAEEQVLGRLLDRLT